MTENPVVEAIDLKNELGSVEISPDVIEVIAGIATTEVDGVAYMKGSFATGVAERLGRKSHGKGIRVDITEDRMVIDIYCVVKFGVSIPTVAEKVQGNVRQALLNMTALEATQVNVHIVGIQFEHGKEVVEEPEV